MMACIGHCNNWYLSPSQFPDIAGGIAIKELTFLRVLHGEFSIKKMMMG
jgi:hypothetical protein